MSNANVSLVQSLYAAFGRGEIAAIVAALAPNVDWTIHGRPQDYPLIGNRKGPAAVQEFFQGVAALQQFSDFSPREFFAVDDRVFVLGHYALTIKKTGAKVDCDWCHVFTVRGGKVTGLREFTDTAQFLEGNRG
jgi:ketosteroid isomerase-like protein